MARGPIRIDETIVIPTRHLAWSYAISSGSGGMHRDHNKTKVRLHWDMSADDSVSEDVKARIRQRYRSHVNVRGQLVLMHEKRRLVSRNEQIVRQRLCDIVKACLHPDPPREKAAPRPAVGQQRAKGKKRRSQVKASRRGVDLLEW